MRHTAGQRISLGCVFRQLGLEIGVLEADRRARGIGLLDLHRRIQRLTACQEDGPADQSGPCRLAMRAPVMAPSSDGAKPVFADRGALKVVRLRLMWIPARDICRGRR
jgi:hypothetical protein